MQSKVENDGIDHINIYSKGKTELGRLLSNFAETPFIHPQHGEFASVEGYWYWLKNLYYTGKSSEKYRTLVGFEAKKAGRALNIGTDYSVLPEFRDNIKKALEAKSQSEPLRTMLKESSLPFRHYYVFGTVTKEAGYGWITEIWESIRKKLKL